MLPLPARPAGAPAGAGVAAGRERKRREGKGGSGGRPAQHAAPRPGAPPQSIFRGAAALRSRRAEPGRTRAASGAGGLGRPGSGVSPETAHPLRRSRLPAVAPLWHHSAERRPFSMMGDDSDACAGAAGIRGGLAPRPAPGAAPER